MGTHEVKERAEGEPWRLFLKRLLDDLHALEKMLDDGQLETDVRRIGAEQELFLVDEGGRPRNAALDVLKAADDPHFTTELALFNLEMNLDPFSMDGDCLSRMEKHLIGLLDKAREAAGRCDAEIVMAGILPSLRKSDMGLENMTPLPRYFALNKSTSALRGGGSQELRIKGVDELCLTSDSVMLESCNASFQVHLQVGQQEFARLYNASQAYAAPILAAAVNSPLLFGRRLWQETRIALFQLAVDARGADREIREPPSRVHFGRQWVQGSVVELFKEDITRFRVIMSSDLDEDPFQKLEAGEPPELQALRLHNSTIWRWNRPCYGITEGKPTLRIENRILPSGPTVVDEMANAALWFGLMMAADAEGLDFAGVMDFEVAKENFVAAARQGLSAQFTWLDGRTLPAQQLIEQELLPRAREGLQQAGVDPGDIQRYLGVIGDRIACGQTGARWVIQSLANMKNQGTASERHAALSRAIIARQTEGKPAHEWPLAEVKEAGGWKQHYVRVEQYMTTDLFTVHEEDSIDLVANMMDWESIRHVPVEDEQHRLVGLVSSRSLLRILAKGKHVKGDAPLPVSAVMRRDPITVSPETGTLEAIEIMRKNAIGCLPVVKEGRLVGILTERDFMVITRELLYQKLKG